MQVDFSEQNLWNGMTDEEKFGYCQELREHIAKLRVVVEAAKKVIDDSLIPASEMLKCPACCALDNALAELERE